MTDIKLDAAYASVVEDAEEGQLFIGFAEGEDESETYVLFRQPLGGGPVWFEVGDESFGAEDAVEGAILSPGRLTITLRAELAARFGYARTVEVGLVACEDLAEALIALRGMLGDRLREV
jgi:hypothetical protein